jgi:hypothetical protein
MALFEHIKVGDEIAEPYGLRGCYRKSSVCGVTSTRFRAPTGREYRRSDGLQIGSASSYYGRRYAKPRTAARERERLAGEAHARLMLVLEKLGPRRSAFEARLTDEARQKLEDLTAQLEEFIDNV